MAVVLGGEALVVTLGLDLREFDKNDHRVNDALKKFTENAEKRTKSFESAGRKAAETFSSLKTEILGAVRQFVEKEILPHATELEHKDEFPEAIVEGMKEMGLFGLMIAEEYGGLGESLLTYALVVVEIARGWMSVSGGRWRG